jgi:anti-anti-sigma regulatory factor
MDFGSNEKMLQGSVIGSCYILSVCDDIEDSTLEAFCISAVNAVHKDSLDGVIFNFNNVNVIDSYTVTLFKNTTDMIALLGAKTVWVGLSPGVISSILDFQIDLEGIQTGNNISHAIGLINCDQ